MEMPEAKLIRSEIVIRDMQLTEDVKMTKNSLVRWLALATGLISPKESRRTMLSLLDALLHFSFSGDGADVHELIEYINRGKHKTNEKALRYHLLVLKNKGLVDRDRGKYRFSVPPSAPNNEVATSFEYIYRGKNEEAFARIRESLDVLKRMYE
ncbi:MAG: hypothetical protein ABIG39_04040 [Candidatus Micrarchaeota archaeon]